MSSRDVRLRKKVSHLLIILTSHDILLEFAALFVHSRRVQELRESRGGRPGLSAITSLMVAVDVKLY